MMAARKAQAPANFWHCGQLRHLQIQRHSWSLVCGMQQMQPPPSPAPPSSRSQWRWSRGGDRCPATCASCAGCAAPPAPGACTPPATAAALMSKQCMQFQQLVSAGRGSHTCILPTHARPNRRHPATQNQVQLHPCRTCVSTGQSSSTRSSQRHWLSCRLSRVGEASRATCRPSQSASLSMRSCGQPAGGSRGAAAAGGQRGCE